MLGQGMEWKEGRPGEGGGEVGGGVGGEETKDRIPAREVRTGGGLSPDLFLDPVLETVCLFTSLGRGVREGVGEGSNRLLLLEFL